MPQRPMTTVQGNPSLLFQFGSACVAQIGVHTGQLCRMSSAFCSVLGYHEAELVGLNYQELIHPDDHHRSTGGAEGSAEAQSQEGSVIRFVCKDGTLVWFEVHTAAVEQDGHLFQLVMAHNVTRQQEAQKALHVSEAQYRSIVERTTFGVAQVDLMSHYTFVNDRYCEIVGRSREELLSGLRMQELTDEADLSENLRLFNHLMEDGAAFFIDKRYVRPNGERVWVRNEVTLVLDGMGRPSYIQAMTLDITERKLMEEHLKQSEARFRRAFDASPMPFSISRLSDGTVLEINDSALTVLGFTREQVIGQRMADLGVRSELLTDREGFVQRLRETRSQRDVEVKISRPSSTTFQALSAYEVVEFSGEDLLLSMFLDVTERRALEREILDVSAREQRRNSGDLHDSVQQQLIGTAMLANRLASTAKASAPELAADIGNLYELVQDAVRGLHAVIRGIMPVQPNAGGLMVALTSMCQRVSGLFGTPCSFRFDQPLLVDDFEHATHLFYIVQEAVINAAKHAEANLSEVRLTNSGAAYTLTVTDDGKGMDEATLLRRNGMGVGLMEYRARLLEIKLAITSTPGQGTTVRCLLEQDKA